MLCNFFDKDGNELASSPERALRRACAEFRKATGLEFQAMGELEYYVISPDEGMFPQATSAVTMNRPRLPNSTISAHGACSI